MILRLDNKLFDACRAQFRLPSVNLSALNDTQRQVEYRTTIVAAFASINAAGGMLPNIAFPELHPYPATLPVNWNWNTFIIGTFPPVSYVRNVPALVQPILQPTGNQLPAPLVPFYHGNAGSLWNCIWPGIIPKPVPNGNAVRASIIANLTANQINYFDVISQAQRKGCTKNGVFDPYPSADEQYRNIIPNERDILTLANTDADDVWIITNTSSTFSTNGLQSNAAGIVNENGRAFDIFLRVVQANGFTVSFSVDKISWLDLTKPNRAKIQAMMKTKVIFYLRLKEKVFTVVSGPSPSDQANIPLSKHPCYTGKYSLLLHPGYANSIKDFKRYVYQQALARNSANLFNLNA